MKAKWMAVAVAVVWAVPAQAMDMQGKWGLGFSAFGLIGNAPEMTLIHGHSNSTAWLMNFQFRGDNQDDQLTGNVGSSSLSENMNTTSLLVGPGVRRFLSPGSDFSPYFDLRAALIYAHSHQYRSTVAADRSNGTTWGAGAEFDVGVEYFTPWHVSVAAHSGLASLIWNSTNTNYEVLGQLTADTHANSFTGHFGVSPVLALRVYF